MKKITKNFEKKIYICPFPNQFVSPGIDRIQPDLLGRPLTEPDPYYKQKFTCVILKRSRYKASTYIYRFHSGRTLYMFSPFNLIRQACIKITTSTLFANFILFTILTNCVFLSIDQQFPVAEYIFAGIYGIEFVIKIVALGGFLDSHTYFRDPWNWLDFIVILITFAAFIGQGNGGENTRLTSLRTFRVLRALKSLSIVPGLRTIVSALLACLKPVFEVVFIMVFLILTIGILGMQSYKGILRTRCVSDISIQESFYLDPLTNSTVWNMTKLAYNESAWWPKGVEEPEQSVCRNASYWPGSCYRGANATNGEANFTCLPDMGPNPNYGLTHFDNIGWAFITCFQLVTLDYWEDVYNMVLRAAGLGHFVYRI